ncbi:hypothetical protein Emag_007633 [Eimeria magna]
MQQQQQQPLLQQLQQLLQQTLQPSLEGVQTAERELEALSKQEAFPQSLLMLLLNQQVDPAVHHAGATAMAAAAATAAGHSSSRSSSSSSSSSSRSNISIHSSSSSSTPNNSNSHSSSSSSHSSSSSSDGSSHTSSTSSSSAAAAASAAAAPLEGLSLASCVFSLLCSAAIYLKNYVRRMWDIDEAQGGVSAANRVLLKQQLLLLLQQQHVSRAVEAQLGEALSRVAATDFPLEWPDLLPALVQQQLQVPPAQQLQQLPQQQQLLLLQHIVRGLSTLHVITKKYRQAMRSEEVLLQLQQILKHVQQPLLSVFTFSVLRLLAAVETAQQQQQQQAASAAAAAPGEMEAALQATLLSSKVFLSLSSVDLPEFFEDNLSSYVLGFVRVLQLPIHPSSSNGNTAADDDDEGDGPVWCAIRPLDSRVRFDLLLSSAAECLSAAAATNWQRGPLPQDLATAAAAFGLQQQQQQELQQQFQQGPANPFQDEALLRDIVNGIILPSLPLRDKGVQNAVLSL